MGTLPIVISVPHGGNLQPSTIPDRTCNSPVTATDANTIETALEIKNSLFLATGCYPHIIISHLKRTKLDPNRNVADGACGNTDAITAWNEFQTFINNAQTTANQQFNDLTFYIDLHGHGHPIQRIELGYLLRDVELQYPDSILNTSKYIGYSSIKNLVFSNVNSYTHAQLLRGPFAFGTMLGAKNYPAVPSQSIPFPDTSSNYFNGGYNTVTHTCYSAGVSTNGLQMELNYTQVRDNQANRKNFATAFSKVLIDYMSMHMNVSWSPCNPLAASTMQTQNTIFIYPSIVNQGEICTIYSSEKSDYSFKIFNYLGIEVSKGVLNGVMQLETAYLSPGLYFVEIENNDTKIISFSKILVE
jgi:hypothetical protein